MKKDEWFVQVFGEKCSDSYEISVVHSSNKHGQESWGWFDEKKLLVLHNGGPCGWPVCEDVWDDAIASARRLSDKLNSLSVSEWPIPKDISLDDHTIGKSVTVEDFVSALEIHDKEEKSDDSRS